MIAQLSNSSEVHKLHVNQNMDLQTPVTVEVEESGVVFAQLYPIGGHYYWRSIGTEFLSLHLLFLPLEVLPKGCHHR